MSYVLQQKHHTCINYDVTRLANVCLDNSGWRAPKPSLDLIKRWFVKTTSNHFWQCCQNGSSIHNVSAPLLGVMVPLYSFPFVRWEIFSSDAFSLLSLLNLDFFPLSSKTTVNPNGHFPHTCLKICKSIRHYDSVVTMTSATLIFWLEFHSNVRLIK